MSEVLGNLQSLSQYAARFKLPAEAWSEKGPHRSHRLKPRALYAFGHVLCAITREFDSNYLLKATYLNSRSALCCPSYPAAAASVPSLNPGTAVLTIEGRSSNSAMLCSFRKDPITPGRDAR